MAKRKRRYEYHSPESEARSKANLLQYRKKTREEIEKEAREFQSKRKNLKDLSIIEFAENPVVLGISFTKRPVQKIILKALYGLPLNEKEIGIFNTLTKGKGKYKPGMEKTEAVMCLGARAGKSFIASICALYEATVGWQNKPWKETLSPGEYVYVCIIATKELQARQIIQTNCLRMLERSPMLKGLIKKSTELEITLRNYVKIISGPCNSTALRGLPIAVLIMDEIAFYRIEGPKADETIFNSLRPRMAQFIEGKLFLISTAGSKQGLFFNFFDEGFRVEDRLTIQANTRFVNPEIPQKFLDKEKARDIDNYMREFEGIFSEKLEAFFSYELMQKPFILAGDLSYKSEHNYYLGLDQSGLSGRDRFALAIAHKEGDLAIVDIVRSWETKDLDIILDEIKTLAKAYHINEAIIDKFSKGYVEHSFKKIGLEVKIRASLADVFVGLKAKMIQDKLQLPDRPDLKAGMRNTIAIYNKSNQLAITHQRGPEGHADEIDAVAGVVFEAIKEEPMPGFYVLEHTQKEVDEESWQKLENWNDLTG
ncbi:hypothetical protein ES695_20010 [Candidatus Atribacteria bacterium 1244-E10-H5-B2]|nr:MAG: hypothetical protein ES695_20010 [Candidatus Atribacteria bacterium 1244-E10-H5-B2]